MEEKQLDLGAPLLSVRRISSTLASSDIVSRKKIDKQLHQKQLSLPLIKSEWDVDEVTKPAAVPFIWEQIPGRPKDGSDPEAQSPVEPLNTPKLPPGRKLNIPIQVSEEESIKLQVVASPLRDCAALLESLNHELYPEGELLSGEDEYSDALDTLSPVETFSVNCSASGLSGYGGSGVKSCGNSSSAERQTRELMLSRFLPAAKAVVVDTPQYVSKKQYVEPARPRLVKMGVRNEGRPLLAQERTGGVPYYSEYIEDTESEDEDEDYDFARKGSIKDCGLLSRLCLRNSLCLLNAVPGLKERTEAPISPAKDINRMARTAYSGPLIQSANKHAGSASYMQKFDSVARSSELQKVKRKQALESPWLSYSSDLNKKLGSSPCTSFRKDRSHPYQKAAPQFPFCEEVGFPGVINGVENSDATKICSHFEGSSCLAEDKQVSGSFTSAVEKTLYMDHVNSLLGSISSGAEGRMDSMGRDFDTTVNSSTKMEECDYTESSVQDLRFPSKDHNLVDADTSSAGNSDIRRQGNRLRGFTELSIQNTDGELDKSGVETTNLSVRGNKENDMNSLFSPRPPPLPRSPSESWLWRTLPSLSSRNQTGFNSQKQQHIKASTAGTKWETIVKTSNMHHDHVRYSEELVPQASQHSKT